MSREDGELVEDGECFHLRLAQVEVARRPPTRAVVHRTGHLRTYGGLALEPPAPVRRQERSDKHAVEVDGEVERVVAGECLGAG